MVATAADWPDWVATDRSGRLNFRAVAPGRVVFCHAVPVGQGTLITEGKGAPYTESFQAGALRLWDEPPPFSLRHLAQGGVRVGQVAALRSSRTWIDAAAIIDDSAEGNAFLDGLGPDGGRLPVSVAFLARPEHVTVYPATWPREVPEHIIRLAQLLEVAVVDKAQYDDAFVYSRGQLSAWDPVSK